MSRQNFCSILMPIVAKIGCSHTCIQNYNNPNTPEDKFIFPFLISYIENRCIIIADRSGNNIVPVGTEIKDIDGNPISEIIARMKTLIPNDVKTDDWENNLLMESDWFRYYLKNALNGFKESYKIKIKKPDEQEQEIIIKSLTQATKPKIPITPKLISPQKNKLDLKILEKNIAYSSIQTCDLDSEYRKKIKSFIDSVSKEKVQNLILDLRYNPGGEIESLSFLLSVFSKRDSEFTYSSMVKSNKSFSFFKYTDGYIPNDILFSNYIHIDGKEGYWNIPNDSLRNKRLNKFAFKGKLFVLVGSSTQSFGSVLASKLYREGAIIIGEETGGGYYSMNGIKFPQVILKGTGLMLIIPMVKIIISQEVDQRIPEGRGLIPNFIVNKTIKSVINGEDNQLDYCIQLIKKQ